MPTPELELSIAGKRFVGWTSVTIDRSMDSLAHTFSVESTTRWNLDEATDISIRIDEGDEVQLWWGEALLLSGWIDEVDEDVGPEAWSVSISGRSKAGDLCDCSAAPKTWRQTPAIDIARELVEPYGLSVQLAPGISLDDKIRRLKSDGDDTVQEVLERLAALAGVSVTSTASGNIEFTGPGIRKAQRALLYGLNLANVRRTQSGSDRFSNYFFRTQRTGSGDLYGADAAHVVGSVTDAGVNRHRPLRVQCERQGSSKELERRAAWERNTRAGRAMTLTVDYQALTDTWRSGPGPQDIWNCNERVVVDVPPFDISALEMLIAQVSLSFGEGGYGARMKLVAPEAYLPDKPPLKKKKKGQTTGW